MKKTPEESAAGSSSCEVVMDVPYNSALQIEHFSNPKFRAEMREVFAHLAENYADYPNGNEVAKVWEITQAVRGLRDHGSMHRNADILGIAAGHEHTVFYLTNYVRRVFATDLYVNNADWKEAAVGMLTNPGALAAAGLIWNPRRLVVQHMDALNLNYEDATFDGIFSCGSLEHFGTLQNVARSVSEMARVLKPGGILSVATEFRIEGPAEYGYPGTLIFTPEMLESHVIRPSGLEPVDTPTFDVSPATRENAYPISEAVEKGTRSRSIALSNQGFVWTSVSLCLRKP